MNVLWTSGLALLGPQLALSAGLVGALASGFSRTESPRLSRGLAGAALIAAAALAALGAAGGSGELIRLDGIGLAWQVLFCLGALPFALGPAGREEEDVRAALLLGSVLGMGLLALSWNLLLLFVGLELMSLPAYLLVSRSGPGEKRSLEGSVKYFFAGAVASALFLMGMALYYASSRSLALMGAEGTLAQAGLALMGAAALFKVGVVPLHFWLPDVYEASAPELAAFLSTAMKAAGVLLVMRLAAVVPSSAFAAALPAAGAVTAVAGAFLALRQENLQRLLAYSSIAHAGLLVLGVGAWAAQGARPSAAAPLGFYLASYLFMSTGAFWTLRAAGVSTRAELKGLGRRDPLLAACFAALLLSLAGIPPTAGFLGKLLILWEAIKAGLYWPAAAAAFSALISLGYYLALVRDACLEEGSGAAAAAGCRGARSLVVVCAVPAALLGLAPWLLEPLARYLSR